MLSGASILFVCGDDEHARRVFAREGRGYWASALPLALEKHGLLGVERATFDALHNESVWERYGVVLVSRAPAGIWTEELVGRAAGGQAGVMIEGPLAPPVARRIGLDTAPWAHRDGRVAAVNAILEKDAARYGYRPAGRVQRPLPRHVNRDAPLAWNAISAVGISERRARVWRAAAWDVQRWALGEDVEVLADWLSDDPSDRFPAVVKRGRLVATNFSLFAYLGQRHTSEPFERNEHRVAARSLGLETLLLAVIDRLQREAGRPRARVLPWPSGIRWVRSVRHDFDRPRTRDELAPVIRGHARERSVATWYWRSRHAPTAALAAVLQAPRHEIALHTERPWTDGDRERSVVEQAVGARIRGSSAHGAPDCFGFQGAPNILWAASQRLDYTECIEHAHLHPHRFASIDESGTIGVLDLVCLPHHESFDRSTKPGDTFGERMRQALPTWTSGSGFLQVMNHPDLNTEELFALLSEMPADGRADWTAIDAVRWWGSTHRADRIQIACLSDGRFQVTASGRVSGLVLEVLSPDGRDAEHVLDLEPDAPQVIGVRV